MGAVANDSNSEITRMYYDGDGWFTLSFIMPYAGEYDFGVSTWGTLSACVCTNRGFPYSGDGGKSKLVIPADNSVVRIRFRYITRELTTEIIQ